MSKQKRLPSVHNSSSDDDSALLLDSTNPPHANGDRGANTNILDPITLLEPITFGDTSGDLLGHANAAAQTIPFIVTTGTLVGDALDIFDHARGGNDTLTSSTSGPNVVIGDAIVIADYARGGDDNISVSASSPLLTLIDFNDDVGGNAPSTGGSNEPTFL